MGCRGEKLAAVDRERIFFSLVVRPPVKNEGWRSPAMLPNAATSFAALLPKPVGGRARASS